MRAAVAAPAALFSVAVTAHRADAQAAAPATPRFVFELEGGPVWQSYNDAQIPNDASATRFSLSGLVGKGPFPAGRAYLTWNINEKHGLRALAAPFSITESGMSSETIRFAGATYVPSAPIEATYTFNSYRLTYRYRFRNTERTTAWVGFTGKIRDANIALSQNATRSEKDDVGFVPLLHLAADRRLADRWVGRVDVDGLAGGPGRAIDAALKLGYRASPRVLISGGYRTLEGGADVDEVYSFAWLHYAVASVAVRW